MTEIEEEMSVNIRQPGIQSRQLNEIRDQLNDNVLISHILNIKVYSPDAEYDNRRSRFE
jgi:hypothetical protein